MPKPRHVPAKAVTLKEPPADESPAEPSAPVRRAHDPMQDIKEQLRGQLTALDAPVDAPGSAFDEPVEPEPPAIPDDAPPQQPAPQFTTPHRTPASLTRGLIDDLQRFAPRTGLELKVPRRRATRLINSPRTTTPGTSVAFNVPSDAYAANMLLVQVRQLGGRVNWPPLPEVLHHAAALWAVALPHALHRQRDGMIDALASTINEVIQDDARTPDWETEWADVTAAVDGLAWDELHDVYREVVAVTNPGHRSDVGGSIGADRGRCTVRLVPVIAALHAAAPAAVLQQAAPHVPTLPEVMRVTAAAWVDALAPILLVPEHAEFFRSLPGNLLDSLEAYTVDWPDEA